MTELSSSGPRKNGVKEFKTCDDKELFDQFKSGNVQAFEEIFDRYHRPIYNLCLRMVGNVEEASDLTQETFAKAFKSLPAMDEVKIFSWLYRVATNLNLDHFRHNKFIFRRPDSDFDFSSIVDTSRDSNPPEVAERSEISESVWIAMLKLSPKYRMVLNLREMQSLSYAEIASMMGSSVSAVESLLHRARAKFKKIYEKMPPERRGGTAACKKIIPLLSPYFDGELKGAKKYEVENHLKDCLFCKSQIYDINKSSNLFKFIPVVAAPATIKSSLFIQLGISTLAGAAAASAGISASAAANTISTGVQAAGAGAAGKLTIGGAIAQTIAGAGAAKITASIAAVTIAGVVTATVATHPSIVKKAEEAVLGRHVQNSSVEKRRPAKDANEGSRRSVEQHSGFLAGASGNAKEKDTLEKQIHDISEIKGKEKTNEKTDSPSVDENKSQAHGKNESDRLSENAGKSNNEGKGEGRSSNQKENGDSRRGNSGSNEGSRGSSQGGTGTHGDGKPGKDSGSSNRNKPNEGSNSHQGGKTDGNGSGSGKTNGGSKPENNDKPGKRGNVDDAQNQPPVNQRHN